jgi:alcohol dehydrogenase (cytochrome c)
VSRNAKRLALLVVLAAGGVFVGLLASGTLSRKTHGSQAPLPTTPPTVVTTGETLPASTSFAPGDWGTYGGTYDEIRHSPLTQIAKNNLNELGRVFTVDFRRVDPTVPKGQQSFPLVVNGTIYVTTGNDHVFAVDGGSGRVLWHYKPANTALYSNFGVNANRGVAYCDGKVFLLTLDMHIVSLDAHDGKVVKDVAISDTVPGASIEFNYSETMAPICFRNTLVVGASGSDYGVRGFVMAYHSDLTPAWPSPYWTIPPDGMAWRRAGRYVGGGTNWNPATIDPQTNTVYVTTSNPSPIFAPQTRPGADPRTDSIVALDLATGRQKWWQQQIAGDQWGYSTTQPVLLYDVKIGGVARRVVSVGTKEGEWFMYDARTGEPIHQRVKLVERVEHPPLKPGKPVVVYPSSLGGLNYSPSSFDPGTGYVVNNQAETAAVLFEKPNFSQANRYKVRGDVDNGLANGNFGSLLPGWHDFGSVTAVDAAKGTVAWRFVTPEPGRGGVTTTAAGIGFAGGGDGILRGFDTKTGNVLWSFQTGSQVASGASVYELGGKEYVAVTLGGTPTSSFGGTASQLMVFALKGDATQLPAPALRPQGPGPGFLAEPPAYLSLAAEPHTLMLQLVASGRGLDGNATLRIPVGWRVNVTVANHSGSAESITAAGFGDSPEVAPGDVGYFHFTPSKTGTYAIKGRSPGESMRLDVVAANASPELVLDNTTYAINLARG